MKPTQNTAVVDTTPVNLSTLQEQALTQSIKHYLDASASQVKPEVAAKLAAAREAALARYKPKTVTQSAASVNRDGTLVFSRFGLGFDWKFWAVGAVMMSALAYYGYQQWDIQQRANDNADIDGVILTGEAPIDAYFDKGFKHWMSQKGQGLE
jgi:Protein of unknown function (DUF3619)